MSVQKIGVVVGSLRLESFNRKIARALVKLAPKSLEFDFIDISSLSLYNQDLDEKPPESWIKLRKEIKSFDGILFATPEYNRSVPGVLKNAIDIGSRPGAENAWAGKPCAVISASPGATGAFGANHHLRQTLTAVNMPTMPHPEVYIGSVHKYLGSDGEVINEDTIKVLQRFIDAFANWVSLHAQK